MVEEEIYEDLEVEELAAGGLRSTQFTTQFDGKRMGGDRAGLACL